MTLDSSLSIVLCVCVCVCVCVYCTNKAVSLYETYEYSDGLVILHRIAQLWRETRIGHIDRECRRSASRSRGSASPHSRPCLPSSTLHICAHTSGALALQSPPHTLELVGVSSRTRARAYNIRLRPIVYSKFIYSGYLRSVTIHNYTLLVRAH